VKIIIIFLYIYYYNDFANTYLCANTQNKTGDKVPSAANIRSAGKQINLLSIDMNNKAINVLTTCIRFLSIGIQSLQNKYKHESNFVNFSCK